jgi:general secretion pathway protein H
VKLPTRMAAGSRSRCKPPGGFTLIEILVVVVIIGIISAAVLLSVNLAGGRDQDLEKESDRLLSLLNYAREQSELQTREYGVIFHQDSYQFVAYDARRGLWREIYEDEVLRLRKLPDGLDVKLIVDARPVVLTPTGEAKPPDASQKKQVKSLKDVNSLKDATTEGHRLGEDDTKSTSLETAKKIAPQVTIFSNGDLSSFEVTLEREGGVRSETIALDDKGMVVAKPMVETKL